MKKYIISILVTSIVLIAATAIAAYIIGNRLELAVNASAGQEAGKDESPVEVLLKNRKSNEKLIADELKSEDGNKALLELQPPYVESIRIFDADGKDCTVDGGWTTLPEKSIVKVTLSGKSTRVDFIIAPTGNDGYLMQKVIGSSYSTGSAVEFSWDVPEDFISGRIWVMAYNNDLARVSEDISIISLKSAG